MTASLTDQTLTHALAELTTRDANLARILDRHGPPPMWARSPGFPTLIHIILEQQVSLASAKAAFDKLLALVSPLTPEGFLTLDDEALRAAGFSRQKTGYSRHLAHAIVTGEFNLEGLSTQPDDPARAALIRRKGIGPWSADIYLLMALLRPDVWPVGDLALQVAMQEVKQLPRRPTAEEMVALGEPWRPWRSVAARLLWHHYLNR